MHVDTGQTLTMAARRRRTAARFLAPTVLTLAFVAGWPFARTIWFGFTDASLGNLDAANWIGFANYLEWLPYSDRDGDGEWIGLLADGHWWRSVWNTLVFTVVTVSVETILGLVVALVLNASFPLRGLVRAAVLIPWAIPTVVSAKMWAWMLNDQFGIINEIGMTLGLLSAPVAWTASADTAMIAVMLVDIWKATPFMALLILAGLQTISADVYEAAKIDGVHPLVTFWRVTLPLAAPAITVAVVFRALDALRVFDIVYVLTPSNAQTRTMSVFVQENLFQFDKFAYGSAASTLLFLVIALIVIGYIRLVRLKLD